MLNERLTTDPVHRAAAQGSLPPHSRASWSCSFHVSQSYGPAVTSYEVHRGVAAAGVNVATANGAREPDVCRDCSHRLLESGSLGGRETVVSIRVTCIALPYLRTSWRSATIPLVYAFTSTRCRATSLSSPSKNGIPSPMSTGMIE